MLKGACCAGYCWDPYPWRKAFHVNLFLLTKNARSDWWNLKLEVCGSSLFTITTEWRDKGNVGAKQGRTDKRLNGFESPICSQWKHLACCRHESGCTFSQLDAGHVNCREMDHSPPHPTPPRGVSSLHPQCVVKLSTAESAENTLSFSHLKNSFQTSVSF